MTGVEAARSCAWPPGVSDRLERLCSLGEEASDAAEYSESQFLRHSDKKG